MNVFTGRKYLKFEKYPDYTTGGKNPSFKIKTLLDLGFTKLVLRIRATGYTQEAIDLARLAFPYVSHVLERNIKDAKEGSCEETGFRWMYCYNYDGELMGSIEDFRNWYKYDIVCFHGCPTGVLYARRLDKYFGFSHRGMAAFGIGDILFEENWKPGWDEVKLEWVQDYCKHEYAKIPSSIEEAKTFVKLYAAGSSILDYIPFKFRGSKEITSKKEAILAAKNFSRHVSQQFMVIELPINSALEREERTQVLPTTPERQVGCGRCTCAICICQRNIKSIVSSLLNIYDKLKLSNRIWTSDELLIIALLDAKNLLTHGVNIEYPFLSSHDFWEWLNEIKDSPELANNSDYYGKDSKG